MSVHGARANVRIFLRPVCQAAERNSETGRLRPKQRLLFSVFSLFYIEWQAYVSRVIFARFFEKNAAVSPKNRPDSRPLTKVIHSQITVAMIRFAAFALVLPLLLCSCDQQARKQAAEAAAKMAKDSVNWAIYRSTNWKNNGCELVDDSEIAEMFGVDPQRDVLNTRTLPDQAFCLRTWNKPDWKERESANEKETGADYLDPQNSLIVQVFNYGTDEHARMQFDMLKRDRRNTYEEDVPGIGEGALWSTTTVTLLVKKGHSVLSIALNCMDTPHDNLAKAVEVAEAALRKM